MLNFLGIGSAFNTELDNTSAYIIEENELLLFDCGNTVFKTLKENRLLEGIDRIHVFITHTHSDHAGSISDLIFYSYYIKHFCVDIYFPEGPSIINLLTAMGADAFHYRLHQGKRHIMADGAFRGFEIGFIETQHVPQLTCYSILLKTPKSTIYYSGDSIHMNETMVEKLKLGEVDKLYLDVSSTEFEGSVHMSYRELASAITPEYRDKVYCMHLDSGIDIEQLKESGFRVPEVKPS